MKCKDCRREIKIAALGRCSNCVAEYGKWHWKPNATCLNCAKEFYDRTRLKKPSKFCSRKCGYSWRKGRHYDGTVIQPIIRKCKICGKEFEALRKEARKGNAIYCSNECSGIARRIDPSRVQVTHPHMEWRRTLGWPRVAKEMVERAGSCTVCGEKKRLTVHHKINPNETRDEILLFAPDNCVVLCRSCHMQIHRQPAVVARRIWAERKCVICGEPFVADRTTRYTCGYACGGKLAAQNKKRNRETRKKQADKQ